MHRISAALAGLAVVVTAGCGTAQTTTPRHPVPVHPTSLHCQHVNDVIGNADNGKTFCVRVGNQVGIILRSTQKDLWLEPLASGGVMKGVPNGALSLVVGATGAWYQATRPGRAVLTSVRPPCRDAISAGQYRLRSCPARDGFKVTIIVLG